MKLTGSNPCPDGEFKSGRVVCECGNGYACLTCEVQAQASLPQTVRAVGIDRNVTEGRWAVLSDGTRHSSPDRVMKVARRKLTKIRLQRAFRAERFARLNRAHQVSKGIAPEYDVACIKALNTRGMTKSAKGTKEQPGKHVSAKSGLNRQILASGWGALESCLTCKMA